MVVFDVGVVALLLWIRWSAHVRGAPPWLAEGFADVPAWWWTVGSRADLVLVGPDAGHWAANVRELLRGGELEPTRLPVYLLATAAMTRIFGDIVFAGHMVTHLFSALTACATYAIGRLTSGRGAALGAAVLVALCLELVEAQQLFGVDPTFGLVAMVMAIACWCALVGRLELTVLAGISVGVAAATHYTGLLFVVPMALLMLLRRDRPLRRLYGALLLLAAWFATWKVLLLEYPVVTLGKALELFSVGLATSQGRDDLGGRGLGETLPLVLDELRDGSASRGFETALSTLGPYGIPLVLAAVLCVVGLAAPPRRRRGERRGWDPRFAALMAALLLPLIGFSLAGGQDRYLWYAYPMLFLCVARGLAAPAHLVEWPLRRWLARWPRGALPLAGCVVAIAVIDKPVLHISGDDRGNWDQPLHERQLGALVRERAPDTPCLLGFSAEASFYADRTGCAPHACSRYHTGDDPTQACRAMLAELCRGDGFGYLVELGERYIMPDQPPEAMDRWVERHGELVGSATTGQRRSRLYLLPCQVLVESP